MSKPCLKRSSIWKLQKLNMTMMTGILTKILMSTIKVMFLKNNLWIPCHNNNMNSNLLINSWKILIWFHRTIIKLQCKEELQTFFLTIINLPMLMSRIRKLQLILLNNYLFLNNRFLSNNNKVTQPLLLKYNPPIPPLLSIILNQFKLM